MQIDDSALEDLARLGLTAEQAVSYAKGAAPYTDPSGNGNRRYESFVFDISEDTIFMIALIGDPPLYEDEEDASNCNN